jgi:hypothetical protein
MDEVVKAVGGKSSSCHELNESGPTAATRGPRAAPGARPARGAAEPGNGEPRDGEPAAGMPEAGVPGGDAPADGAPCIGKPWDGDPDAGASESCPPPDGCAPGGWEPAASGGSTAGVPRAEGTAPPAAGLTGADPRA